jgi:hypothetical protein
MACECFTNRLLDAMSGEPNVIECAYVENNLTPAPFFSTRVRNLFAFPLPILRRASRQ